MKYNGRIIYETVFWILTHYVAAVFLLQKMNAKAATNEAKVSSTKCCHICRQRIGNLYTSLTARLMLQFYQ